MHITQDANDVTHGKRGNEWNYLIGNIILKETYGGTLFFDNDFTVKKTSLGVNNVG